MHAGYCSRVQNEGRIIVGPERTVMKFTFCQCIRSHIDNAMSDINSPVGKATTFLAHLDICWVTQTSIVTQGKLV